MDSTLIISPETLTLYCIVAVLLLFVLKCTLGRRQSSRGAKALPCLPSVPFLGSLLHLRSPLPPHLLFSKLASRYGPLFSLYMGPHYTLVVSEVTLAREVLLHRGKDFAGRPKMVSTNYFCLDITYGWLYQGCLCVGTIEFCNSIPYTRINFFHGNFTSFLNKIEQWSLSDPNKILKKFFLKLDVFYTCTSPSAAMDGSTKIC